MPHKDRRFLGDLDAAADLHFKEHFVESIDLERLLNSQSHIVYGSKGVGKTALRRALTELHSQDFYSTKTIDLDQLSFNQVHEALSRLRDTSRTEIPTLARNTWRNVLAMYCLEAATEQMSGALANEITELLQNEGFVETGFNSRIIGQIERLFGRLADFGLDDAAPTPLSLSSRQLGALNDFPANTAVASLLTRCSSEIARSRKAVLVCLDGFDSIVDHSEESRSAIFAGLIDAIHKSSKDPLLRQAFCFKAFLPQELAAAANALVWDADKFMQQTHHLRWSLEDFQRFLARRLSPYAKTRSARFLDMWHEFMPEKVRNDIHGIDEPTFDYVLRHTLHRPRQVLAHVQRIIDRWDEKSGDPRIDPSFIPQVVAGTNYDLAESVVNQLEIKHPGLHNFMRSWNGACNTMNAAKFKDRIKRQFGTETPADLLHLFDDLFDCGVFGLASKQEVATGSQRTKFRFGFVGDRTNRRVHTAVDDDDIVALSPMFHEYCGCTASSYGAIIPVAM